MSSAPSWTCSPSRPGPWVPETAHTARDLLLCPLYRRQRAKTVERPLDLAFQCGSGDSLVLVDHAAEDAVSANRSVERDEARGVVVGWAVIAALVRSVVV